MPDTRRALLDALADGPVPGPELADRLGVSRAAVWKQVEALREDGLGIESTDDGYRVTDVSEFGGAAIAYGLDAPFEIEYHDSIGSTNERVRELADEGREDVAVVANEQTAGRGRLDRGWTGPSGGVYCSLLLRPDVPLAHSPVYTLAAAVAVARAAREAGVDARIKWPNDVLVLDDESERGGQKLCGILTEMEGEADRVKWLIVGIGINANVEPEDLPEGATSLLAERGEPVDRRIFTQRLLETFDELRSDPDSILDAWREHAATLGQRVRVETPGGEVVGKTVDVEFPGALIVETDDGERERVTAGDCEHLRPV
ncbi:biotin--[acetyl-CoA-carboxylase] ligase [Halolamina sp. CBA1230]|uniref:biotin--[acetyl-CoA-carboxylase] ligase n=1 Tax=Halolamina sp. CBA1230 TaxID=1853690 RepID=UPI0009A25687|nr:biotin--[acetyl-CoA-carboxylase] ligase [Halolamina sp. CBA1230]QKY19788.1 biotin--[acetyl-CoA-carboxylase] ligase [Halolamina sp. CBA1230]